MADFLLHVKLLVFFALFFFLLLVLLLFLRHLDLLGMVVLNDSLLFKKEEVPSNVEFN